MAVPIVMPQLGLIMTEGTLAKWMRSPGDSVKQGEPIAEIETEKISYELEATDSGAFHPVVAEGAIVSVDGILGYLLADGEAPPEAPTLRPSPSTSVPAEPASRPRPAAARPPGQEVASTPGARRLASNLGVDISKVTATGPRGRVTDADVRAYAEPQPAAARVPPGLPGPSEVVPVAGIRKAIADHMRGSISSTAQLSYFLEVDVTEAMRLRKKISKSGDVTLTSAHVLIKACAEILRRTPALNSVLSEGNLLHFDDVNIGVAVSLEEGLIVPVLKQVDKKDIFQISTETHSLAVKAREGKLLPDEVTGGTFTISVLGTVDGFTPILNQSQNAILGVGRSVEKPVARDGEVVIREMITLSLTADHQAIDGAVAAGFLQSLKETIENPGELFKKGQQADDRQTGHR